MKHFIIFITLMFTSLSAQAQFSQTIGSPDNDFRTSQIRSLGGNTYVSGWLIDPNAVMPELSAEGVLVRLDASGSIDWMYQLSSNTPAGLINGTRIFDFDFDDDEGNIVFVGATTLRNGIMLDNECIVGMVDINTGAGVFQQAYDFRASARESFQRIINNPSPDATDADSYIISGLINDATTGAIDNYVSARAIINPNNTINVDFVWIDENHYTSDEEMHRMRVLEVGGNLQVAYAGTSIPNRVARINFHSIATGNIINEYAFNLSGTVMDVAQIGNSMIAVGRLRSPNRAFIASIDLNFNVTSSLTINNFDRFSRVIIEPNTGDILAVGEQNAANPAICRFDFSTNQLVYSNASVLDFGTNSLGDGLLVTEGNAAIFADTRTMLATFGLNQSAAVFRTNLDFISCNTDTLSLTTQPAGLVLSLSSGIIETDLIVPDSTILALEQDTLCTISLCGNGFNLNNVIPVFHNSRSHYVKVADIDNDGWDDFAVPEIRFGNTPRFNISMNNQNLAFTNIPSSVNAPPLFGDAESMQFIDLDGLGDLDIVVQRQGRIEVFIENGSGNYALVQAFDVTVATPPFGGNTLGLFRSDFDLVHYNIDNFEDLVVTGASTGGGQEDRIAVFEGTGNPNSPFITVPIVTMDGLPAIKYWETVHVDVDPALGNGNDLLLGQAGYNSGQQSVFGYLNTGNPATIFNATPDLNYETPLGLFWPRGMEMVNIDANPQLDLIVAMQGDSQNGGQVVGEGAVLISRDIPTAPGSYTAASLQWETLNIPGAPVGIAVGDIDNDGDDDLAVAIHSGTGVLNSFVRIFENNGSGNFFNFIDVSTPIGQTVELEFADFNNDCCLDIVTTQWNGNMSYVLINDCQTTEFSIRGRVVCENDPCDYLTTPNGVPNQTVEITDGTTTYYAITDPTGGYEIFVPAGSYDIGVSNVNYGDATCLNAHTADVMGFQPATNLDSVNFFIEDQCLLDVDMVAGLLGFAGSNTCPFVATPCDSLIWEYCFDIENNTCSDQDIDQIYINLPHGITIGNVTMNPLEDCVTQMPVATSTPSIIPTNVQNPNLFGSTVNYNINSTLTIPSGGCFTACIEATFTGNFTLPVTAEVDVQYSCGGDPEQSTTSGVAYQDTCSCDPNLKLAYFPQNCGSLEEVLDQPIEYTIQFTNIGQSPAFDIRVLDQLDSNLDFSTFQWLGSSHPASSINIASGLLEVYFNNINLAPGGIGWLRFSIKPNSTTANSTTIYNYADIIFDNNAPVSTNITETLIQESTAQADLQFNAAEYCVGDKIIIDFTWTGDAAWLNYTQNGTVLGQNVVAPSSGSQVVFIIPDDSYVGLWEYELVAYDSITGCTDTALVIFNIYDCDCDLNDQLFMSVGQGAYEFSSNVFNTTLNPGFDIIDFKWHLGDGTVSTDQSPVHQYKCKKLGPHTVVVCLYYVAEINGIICEGEICQEFEVCQNDYFKTTNIYPNPASNQITVQSEVLMSQTDVLTVETYTIEGKLLKAYKIKADHDRVNLKLSNNYKGLVYMRILNHRGEVLLEDRFLKLNNRTD